LLQCAELGLTADKVHYRVNGEPPDEFSPLVDDRSRYQVVSFERAGGLLHLVEHAERRDISLQRRNDRRRWICQKQRRQGDRPAEHVPGIDDKQAVRLGGS